MYKVNVYRYTSIMFYVIDESWDLRIGKNAIVLVSSLGFSAFPSVWHSTLLPV